MPTTCPYPEPPRSSPYPHIPIPEDPSYYYPTIYAWVSQVVSFLQVPPSKPCIHHTPHSRYMPCPSHSSRFDHPNDIWWAVRIIRLLVTYFSPFLCYLTLLDSTWILLVMQFGTCHGTPSPFSSMKCDFCLLHTAVAITVSDSLCHWSWYRLEPPFRWYGCPFYRVPEHNGSIS